MYSDDDKTYAYKSSHKAFMNTGRYFHDADALQDDDNDNHELECEAIVEDLHMHNNLEGNGNPAGANNLEDDILGTVNLEAVTKNPVTPVRGLGMQASEFRADRFARLKQGLRPAKLIYDDPGIPLPLPPSVIASREKALIELRADMSSDASRGRVTNHPI